MNPGKTFTQFCAEIYEGGNALYRMIFDLVYRKLLTIFLTCDVRLLVRKVREPNQADHVIGHLDVVFHARIQKVLTEGVQF